MSEERQVEIVMLLIESMNFVTSCEITERIESQINQFPDEIREKAEQKLNEKYGY